MFVRASVIWILDKSNYAQHKHDYPGLTRLVIGHSLLGMGSKSSKDRIEVAEYQLVGFEVNRKLYFWIILVISVLALIGNVLAIRTVVYRKYKYLQKTCIISLAVSDMMSVVLFAMNNLFLLHVKPMIWIYGEFLCHYSPVGQVLGNLTSSVALLTIALDRYHNVIHALSKKWNPPLWKCLMGATTLWLVCFALSYPVVTFYIYIPIIVNGRDTAMCSGAPITKSTISLYYICMNCLFFIPIVLMFFWFYYKIALLIWKHRKPPSHYSQQDVSEISSITKDSTITPSKPKKNVQMERKLRSFKIVVALKVAFIGCRLPYWLFMLYQQMGTGDRNVLWNIRFSCISLYLLNCVLNPLLYTFLNVTMMAFRKLNTILTTTCFCWCSNSDFEEFEAGKPMADVLVDMKNDKSDRLRVQFTGVGENRYMKREAY